MTREIRRVIADWEHPRKVYQGYFDDYTEELRDIPMIDESVQDAWDRFCQEYQSYVESNPEVVEKYKGYFQRVLPPDPEHYRPQWRKEDMTWYQMYEIVSDEGEGVPITPPFATQQELIDYLMGNGDFRDQSRIHDPRVIECKWSRSATEKIVLG